MVTTLFVDTRMAAKLAINMDKGDVCGEYQCGFCLNNLPEMLDPRILPCQHPFCLACLKMETLIHKTIQCPLCSVNHGIVEADKLASFDIRTTTTPVILCDSCLSGTGKTPESAQVECTTCDLRFCLEHEKLHRQLAGDKHDTKCISSESGVVPYSTKKPELCTIHKGKEVLLVCEKCHHLFCSDCEKSVTMCTVEDQTPHQAVNNQHRLRSVDFMAEKLSRQFPKNASKLYEKEKEIARYNKVLCRRLEAINDKGEKMLKQVDQVTNQQIEVIKCGAETLKEQIKESIDKNSEIVETEAAKLTVEEEKMKKLRENIQNASKMHQISELLKHSKTSQDAVGKCDSIILKRCHLQEQVLIPTKQCRQIELTTRNVVPVGFEVQRSIDIDSTAHSLGFLGQRLLASGCGENIRITLLDSGQQLHNFHCNGMTRFATEGGMLYALCQTNEGQFVKTFSSDLQMSWSIPLSMAGKCTMISAAKGYIAVYDEENNVIHILSKDGHHQLDMPIGQQGCKSICCTNDGCILVAHRQLLIKLHIGSKEQKIWSCSKSDNNEWSGMAHDQLTGITFICTDKERKSLELISSEGELIKRMDCERPSNSLRYYGDYKRTWSIDVANSQMVLGIDFGEEIKVYHMKFD